MFDFFNNNYCALISIFAAVMGMSYPLILQAIQKIDEMYNGTCLAAYFQKMWPFRLYNASLMVAIPVSILAPFILYFLNNNTWCIIISVIHTIVIIILLFSSVLLFKYIMLTTRPQDFRKLLVDKCKGDNPPLVELFQIAKYASDKEDLQLYSKTIVDICAYVFHCREYRPSNGYTQYPRAVWALLKELLNQHGKKDNHFFSSCDFISNLFFTPTDYYPLSEEEYIYLWSTVDAVVQTDNSRWVYSYWTFADQYYRFVLNNYDNHSNDFYIKQKERFQQMHFMVGALLIYNKKFGLLNELMFFSNSLPPSYELVPSSFCKIWDIFSKFIIMQNYPALITQRYNMIGAPQDVSSDAFIIEQAYKYVALLIIRLHNVNNWNITYSNPLEPPSIDNYTKIEDINEFISVVNRIKGAIQLWYNENDDFLRTALNGNCAPEEWTMQLCDSFIEKCIARISILNSSTTVDPMKIDYIKKHLIQAVTERPLRLPTINGQDNPEDYIEEIWNNEVAYQISKEILSSSTYTNASNLPDLLIDNLNAQLYKQYNKLFLINSCTKSFRIAYKDIKKVFNAIGIDASYSVLLMGIYLGNFDVIYDNEGRPQFVGTDYDLSYNQCPIYSIPSSMQCIMILKKNSLPYIKLCTISDTSQVTLIDNNNYLYSNIDSLNLGNNRLELIIHRGVKYCGPKTHIKYLRFNVDYSNDTVTNLNDIANGSLEVFGK